VDNKNQQSEAHDQLSVRRAAITPVPGPTIPNSNNNPKLNIPDEQAQALLTINNLQSSHAKHKSTKPRISLLITLAMVVIIVIIASIVLDSLKSRTNSKTPSPNSVVPSSSSSNTNTDSTTKQINQDVNSCTNPLVAVSQC
jgi:hypothetical protein